MTIHPTKHIDYSRGDRVDHLFVVGEAGPTPAETALLVSVTDTGLDCVLDDQTAGWRDRTGTKGWSLTWAEVIAAVQESDHNGVVTLTTVRSTADDKAIYPEVPDEWEVQPDPDGNATCGACGLSWDDTKVTGITPTPSGRCPFEYFHVDESIEDPRLCDCGKGDWCPLWDSWTGPGKTERDERVKAELVMLEEHSGTLEDFLTEMADLRRRVEETLSNG